jgi:hypothetical protein
MRKGMKRTGDLSCVNEPVTGRAVERHKEQAGLE